MKDVFAVQDEITRTVVENLGKKLFWGEETYSFESTTNPEAYDLYLRARTLIYIKNDKAAGLKAIKLLEQAIEIDPNYTTAMAWLGTVLIQRGRYKYSDNPEQEYKRAEALAKRALAINEANPEALRVLASFHASKKEFDQAIVLSKEALALEPNNFRAQAQLAWKLAQAGRAEEGVPIITRAVRNWPHPPPAWRAIVGHINLHAAMENVNLNAAMEIESPLNEKALAYFNAAAKVYERFLQPPVPVHRQYRQAHLSLIVCYMILGRETEARREAEKFKQIKEWPFKYFAQTWRKSFGTKKRMQGIEHGILQAKKAGLEE